MSLAHAGHLAFPVGGPAPRDGGVPGCLVRAAAQDRTEREEDQGQNGFLQGVHVSGGKNLLISCWLCWLWISIHLYLLDHLLQSATKGGQIIKARLVLQFSDSAISGAIQIRIQLSMHVSLAYKIINL